VRELYELNVQFLTFFYDVLSCYSFFLCTTEYCRADGIRGGVRSTRGLGPTMTAQGQSIGIPIGMLPQTLIMSRLDQLSRLGVRI